MNKLAGVIENYSKFWVCAVLRFLQAETVGQSKIHHRIVSVYSNNIFSRKQVSGQCISFKDGPNGTD
jgi:hypothetical protein